MAVAREALQRQFDPTTSLKSDAASEGIGSALIPSNSKSGNLKKGKSMILQTSIADFSK